MGCFTVFSDLSSAAVPDGLLYPGDDSTYLNDIEQSITRVADIMIMKRLFPSKGAGDSLPVD